MITRFKINGFKNLTDVDVRFGPFNCIAGANAIGKSNLFDAIRFLSMLASEEIIEAAKKIRSEGQRASDIRDIFNKIGNKYSPRMSFEVDLIIPEYAYDDLGAQAKASITTVRYILTLKLTNEESVPLIEVEKEELVPIRQQDAQKDILFPSKTKWKKSVIKGRRGSNSKFISTETKDNKLLVRLHQDQEKGKPFDRDPSRMGRTALSTVSAEFPTACVVKEELRSWTFLQLEPSSLRKSDEVHIIRNAKIKADGAHMPATLYRLESEYPERDIMQEVTNRLSELIDDNLMLKIEKDDKRDLLTLILTQNQTELPARSLSDGTLRFLALTILEVDYSSGGLICLEEPENGIHPKKIEAMISLLKDIACDPNHGSDIQEGNPLRQVIINTHSPLVVQYVPDDSLLVAENIEYYDSALKKKYKKIIFSPLPNTWRKQGQTVSLGKLLDYLGHPLPDMAEETNSARGKKTRRVIDNKDISKQLHLFNS